MPLPPDERRRNERFEAFLKADWREDGEKHRLRPRRGLTVTIFPAPGGWRVCVWTPETDTRFSADENIAMTLEDAKATAFDMVEDLEQ